MTQTILLLVALFVSIMIAASYYWSSKILKFISVALLFLLANAVYFSLDGVKGWPSEDTRVVKGVLASVVIVNPTNTDEGAIYISIFPTTPRSWYEYEYPRHAPKTFYVKYSNDRAAKFEEAKQAMEEGKEVRINGIPPENTAPGDGNESGDDSITGIISGIINKMIKSQKDTYKPDIPDVEILTPVVPPEKGTNP
jgi:hypothetical protein